MLTGRDSLRAGVASPGLKVLFEELKKQIEILVGLNWDSSQSQKCLRDIFLLNNLIGFSAKMDKNLKDKMLQLQSAINGITLSVKTHDIRRLRDSVTSAEAILNSLDNVTTDTQSQR